MWLNIWTAAGVGASLVLAVLMWVSAADVDFRLWPPGEYDWRFWVYMTLGAVPVAAVPAIWIGTMRSFIFGESSGKSQKNAFPGPRRNGPGKAEWSV